MNRKEALELVKSEVSKKNLIKHMLATEIAMKFLAEELDGDPKKWGLAGLLHDLDYDKTCDDFENHGILSAKILSEYDIEQEIINAIRSHPNHEAYPPETTMAKALYSVDSLTGLIVAAALMHPDKKLKSLDSDFIMRRFGEKRFAAGANREQIKDCEKLGIDLERFIDITLKAMQSISDDLGL